MPEQREGASEENGFELSASYREKLLLPARRVHFFDLCLPHMMLPLGRFNVEILNWGRIEPFYWHNEMHKHSFFELCYTWQGRGTYVLDDREMEVRTGDVFVSRPEELHQVQSNKTEPLGIYCVSFSLLPGPSSGGSRLDEAVSRLLESFAEEGEWIAALPGRQALFEWMSEEIVRRQTGFELAMKGLFVKLLLDTARALANKTFRPSLSVPPPRTPDEVRLRQAVRFIEDNYHRPITVRDVAGQVYLSERHTSRMFRNLMGKTILSYLTELRMRAAMQFLMEQNRSVKEVARACGFPDVRYFITRFGKFTGMTPTQFRKSGGSKLLSELTAQLNDAAPLEKK